MGFERDLSTVAPILFTADGGTEGQITLATTLGLFVKQIAQLKATGVDTLTVQIKRVLSPTQILVGLPKNPLQHRVDVSAFTVALGANISCAEQPKSTLPMEERLYASYIQEPSNSWRVTPVDSFGNSFDSNNPLPIEFGGTVAIGDVHILGPSPDKNELNVNGDGSINVNIVSAPVSGNAVINQYGEANSVATGATTNVVQYTVPLSSTSAILQRISVSGENIAKFTVFINTDQIDTRRTYYGNSLSEYFEFTTGGSDGVTLAPNDTVTVKVLHNRPYAGDFEGRIQVLEIT